MSRPRRGHELVETLHEYSLDLKNREIYLAGHPDAEREDGDEPGVEDLMATRFIKNLRFLSTLSSSAIRIHMKTCGGVYEEGMAIYDSIYFCPCPVTVLSYTHARSMSSVILQAADKRVLMPNSYFMLHEGTLELRGQFQQTLTAAEWEKRIRPVMLDIYASRMHEKGRHKGEPHGKIKKRLRELMQRKVDVFLAAEEAVDWGLADVVFDGNWEDL